MLNGNLNSISGMKESPIENYFLTDIDVEAGNPGEIAFAKGWRQMAIFFKSF